MELIDLRDIGGGNVLRTQSLLLVEDDDADARLLQVWLRRSQADWEVTRAASLVEALAALEDWSPDLIISDLGLPDAQGLQAAEKLVEVAQNIPIVVLTGAENPDLALEALELGAEDYITKDQLSEDTLRRAMRFALTRHHAQRRLRKLASSLEAADSDLGEFAHMVAHDVRAPLRTSRLLAQAICQRIDTDPTADDSETSGGEESSEQSEQQLVTDLGRRLDKTLGHLDALVQSMLDYAGLRETVPIPEAVAVSGVVNDALDSLAADILKSGTTIDIDIDTDAKVMATPAMLCRIVENLVSNAMKFTRTGELPRVSITIEAVGPTTRVMVSDQGIGVPAADREHVFNALERLDTSIEGTGFGLAICRRMAKAQGGNIWIEASDGPGTDVVLELPTAR